MTLYIQTFSRCEECAVEAPDRVPGATARENGLQMVDEGAPGATLSESLSYCEPAKSASQNVETERADRRRVSGCGI